MTKYATSSGNVLTWATDLEERTAAQAEQTASMPFVIKPLALMADAHLGKGSTIGSVIATRGAIIPAAVGVDIGCGMIAARLTITASDLPDNLDAIHAKIAAAIPAGIPSKSDKTIGIHRNPVGEAAGSYTFAADHMPYYLDRDRVIRQYGTLGSGNHFIELCTDETDDVWIVLHSGSRGAGNLVARRHIKIAQELMDRFYVDLVDKDLAYLPEHTPEFENYIRDMDWAQEYAYGNREQMLHDVLAAIQTVVPHVHVSGKAINCHHNYTTMEHHHNQNLWITRKGAIRARQGDLGVIPGSMATGSYIVRGLGSAASYCSASHGAGRRMSRTAARKTLTTESLDQRMDGIAWNHDAEGLLDEHPESYKDIETVMEAQADLVEPLHRLTTILNFKGN